MSSDTLAQRLKYRRKGGCQYAPCAVYVPKSPDDYGYGSCTQCGWSEPEHLIDELAARCRELEEERDNALLKHGVNAGFWGRMAARATLKRNVAEAKCRELQAQLDCRDGNY